MQIRDLEERYDVRLFDRIPSGVSPTDAGRRFYRRAVELLRSAYVAEQELHALKGEVMGRLHIGLMPTFTRSVLPTALQRVKAVHPMIEMSITEAYSAQLCEMTVNGELDFSIVPAMLPQDGLVATPIGQDREFLVSSPSSPLAHGKKVRLRDVAPLRLVLPGQKNARRPAIEHYLASQGVEADDILEIDAMLGTLELVAGTDWMTILPGLICHGDADGVQRKIHPISDPVLPLSYVRIESATRSLGEAAEAFEQILIERMEELLLWSKGKVA